MRRFHPFTCSFTLRGLNLERFLSLTHREGVPLDNVTRLDGRTLRCECRTSDLRFILQLAADKGWRVRNIRPRRMAAWLFRLRSRPGLIAGFVLMLTAILLLSQRIWRVEIHGAGPYQAEIASYLAEEGLVPGIARSSVNAADWESRLSWRYPEVSWFHAYASGMTFVVDCTLGRPMPSLPQGEPGDLVASRDGVIASIQVFAGVAAVKPGDVVRKGQVLIRGVERGRDETSLPVAARGAVTARCWRTVRVQVPLTDVKSWETGRETTTWALCTPWFRLPAKTPEPEYLTSNRYLSRTPLGGAFFPLWREETRYREVALELVSVAGEERKAEALAAAEERLAKALKGYEIIDKWVDYCMIEGEFIAVSMTGEWQMEIGETAT